MGDIAFKILKEAGMKRLGQYDSKKAHLEYLDSEKLKKIHDLVAQHRGNAAAYQFTQMVADVPNLSIRTFYDHIHELDDHGWIWDKSFLKESDPAGAAPVKFSLSTAFTYFSQKIWQDYDHTEEIRGPFLDAHAAELRTDQYAAKPPNPAPG